MGSPDASAAVMQSAAGSTAAALATAAGQSAAALATAAGQSAAALATAAAARASREFAGKVLAATLRTVRDLDIAEDSTADAFLHALQTWPRDGVPASVDAWLITTARNRAYDRIRRAQVGRRALLQETGGWSGVVAGPEQIADAAIVGDDELRMVVLCCDPRLAVDEQVALTLRLACGVPTAAIAAGYGVPPPTMAARITRAKAKLARGGPQLDLPDDAAVDSRLPAVAKVVYLAATLGHTAATGADLVDDDLVDRAQYLARVLHRLRPAETELTGLLGLILLTRARATGRIDAAGDQVLLAEANRSLWDPVLIREGLQLVTEAVRAGGSAGPVVLQALIAGEHAHATTWAATDWASIVRLYSQLLTVEPAHTVAVGRSVAVGELAGAAAGLADLDGVLALGGLDRYPYAHAARGYLLDRLGQTADAATEWRRAATLARTDAERSWFTSRAGTG
jgi:RNA polymerase sigma-70 factor, ECF subfamily